MHQDHHALPYYLRAKRGSELLGIGESTFWSLVKDDPRFPKGIKFGARTTVFRRADLLAWAESHAQQEV